MVTKKNLIDSLNKWRDSEWSTWRISNWAVSQKYTNGPFESDVVEELIDMLSNVGADLDFCTTLSSKQYLQLADQSDFQSLESSLENIEGELDEELDLLYPSKEEFFDLLNQSGWFDGESEEVKAEFSELVEFKGLPNLENQYFLNQEIFWLRLLLPSAVYNEMVDGNLVEEFNFDFINQLDPISDVTLSQKDGKVKFLLDGVEFSITLDLAQDEEEIIRDFFQSFRSILESSKWELVLSDSYLDVGDLMFVVLADRQKLINAYKSGAVRALGEKTSEC